MEGGAARRLGRADALRDEEELQLALRHLEPGFMNRFTRFVFNPVNPFIAGAGVLGSVVAAQTAYLQSTYMPLPPPAREVSCGYIPYGGSERSAGLRRVVVIGDSLVLSIGCAQEPVFAQSIATGISAKGRVDVSWRSFGVDGGDANTIREACLDNVRAVVQCRAPPSQPHQSPHWGEEGEGKRTRPPRPPETAESTRQRHEAHRIWCTGAPDPSSAPTSAGRSGMAAAGGHDLEGDGDQLSSVTVDVCVILCGLNDFKKLWKGRTASLFSQELGALIQGLRRILGPHCVIALPAMPMEPTRFPEPLRSFVIYIAEVFDKEKEHLAKASAGSILFIPKPSVRWWKRVHERYGGVISEDGIHPNEVGYQVYGEWLGAAVSTHLLGGFGFDGSLGNGGGVLDLSGHLAEFAFESSSPREHD